MARGLVDQVGKSEPLRQVIGEAKELESLLCIKQRNLPLGSLIFSEIRVSQFPLENHDLLFQSGDVFTQRLLHRSRIELAG